MKRKPRHNPPHGVMHGPAAYSKAEFRKLLAAASKLPGEFRRPLATVKRSLWWRCYLAIARDTGLPYKTIRQLRGGGHYAERHTGCRTPAKPARAGTRSLSAPQVDAALLQMLGGKPQHRMLYVKLRYRTFVDEFHKLLTLAGLGGDYADKCGYRLTFANGMRCKARPKPTPIPVAADEFDLSSTLASYFDGVYLPLKLRNRSPHTERLYRRTVTSFGEFLGRDATLADLTDDTVARHLAALTRKGLRPHTVVKERDQLLAIWRFASNRRTVPTYPTLARERLPEYAPVAWKIDELGKLIDAAAATDGHVGKVPAGQWWKALILAMYDSAERITALLSAEWSNVDFVDRRIIIEAAYRKGKTRDVSFSLSGDTIAALTAIRGDGKVFPWPYSQTYIYNRYTKILKRAGLPHDAKSKFHRIRRTTASYFEQAGGDATALLDHSSRDVTKKYLDARIVEKQRASDILPRPSLADESEGGAT